MSLIIQRRGYLGRSSTSPHWIWLTLPGKRATAYNGYGGQDVSFVSHVVNPSANLWQEKTDSLGIARMWLRQCTNSHEVCRNIQEYKRPARLLSFDRDTAKLVLTETFRTMPQYATLSYCWGHNPFMMLTVATMNSFLEGFDISSLPKVFRDAIHVACELGLSYIWIDALCIIQEGDSNNDWLTESGHMKSVYGNSFVNLAASSATNVHESLFSKPDHYNGGFCARVTTNIYSTVRLFHDSEAHQESTKKIHLATRAWTFQERLLPARTMFIGNTGIYWECRSAARSEFMPDWFPGPPAQSPARSENQAWDWKEIVTEYSLANLTKTSDRLPALAGVARRQHEATGHSYLAGLWREPLITELCWELSGEHRKRPPWRAPSWSWVSVDGQVFYWDDLQQGLREYISVVDAWTTPSGPDLFGQVSSGLLSLKCSALLPAKLIDSASTEGKFMQWNRRLHFVSLEAMAPGVAPQFPVSMDVLEDEWASNEVYLVPVFGGTVSFVRGIREAMYQDEEREILDIGNQVVITGLVLRACGENTSNEGRFSRVGSFNFKSLNSGYSGDERWHRNYYKAFVRILDGGPLENAEPSCSGIALSHDCFENWLDIAIE